MVPVLVTVIYDAVVSESEEFSQPVKEHLITQFFKKSQNHQIWRNLEKRY